MSVTGDVLPATTVKDPKVLEDAPAAHISFSDVPERTTSAVVACLDVLFNRQMGERAAERSVIAGPKLREALPENAVSDPA